MSHRPPIVLLLAAFVCVAVPVRAQDQDPVAPYLGKVVSSVRLVVEGRLEVSPALLSLIDVKAQQPFTREAYLSSIKRLQRLAPYAAVEVQITDDSGILQVMFVATPFHPVDTLQFIDDAGLHLDRRVKERFGGPPTDVDPDQVQQAALEVLRDEGYLQATVTFDKVLTHKPCRATIVFHIAAGPHARVGIVTWDNRSAIPIARLESETGAKLGQTYTPRAIRDALAAAEGRLKKDGYYSATAEARPAEPADNTVDLTIAIDPGPHVVLQWAKGSQPPAGDIRTYVPIAQQNSIDDDLLNDSDTSIAQVLRNQGYLDAKVTHTSEISPAGEKILTYLPIRGPRYRIDHIETPNTSALTPADIIKALGFKRGDVLESGRLTAGLQRIKNAYLTRGFYRVAATSEQPVAENRPATSTDVFVVLRPKITEGPQGVIAEVRFDPAPAAVQEDIQRAVIRAARADQGQLYQERANDAVKYALEGLYLDLGYRQAKVEVTATASADGRAITRVVHIVEGPLITVGDIRIVGFHDITEKAIREELALGVGMPYSEAARLESRRKINGMGVFTRVTVQEDPLMPGETEAHLVIRVVEAPDTTIGFGGGVEAGSKKRAACAPPASCYVDRLEFAPRGFMEIGRRNLGGRNRALDLFTRISLRPKDVPNDPARDGKGYSFSEYRVALTYRERRAFHTDIDWILGLTAEQAIRTSFNFKRQAITADFLRRLTARTTATLRYSLDFTKLYDVRFTDAERLQIDRVFNQVRLSMLSLAVVTDHRDDAVAPTRGTFSSAEIDSALRGIGSEVGFAKLFVQSSAFRCVFLCQEDKRLAGPGRSIVAVRAELGIARGFTRPDPSNPGGTIADVPASQRFFSGGSTTNRGFPLDALGVPDVLTPEGLPKGGNGLLVLNAELRTLVGKLFGRNLTTVQFVDAGNVFAKALDVSLGQLRASLGTGLRYDSPLGPVRLDFGFKLSRHIVGSALERGWTYHLSFGEAF